MLNVILGYFCAGVIMYSRMPLKAVKKRILIRDFLAELLGAILYSFLFFLFVHRSNFSFYELSNTQLSVAIGMAYFVAVYLPFLTYRIHIFPFISVLTAMIKGDLLGLLRKLGAQAIGALIGVLFFAQFIDAASEVPMVENFYLLGSKGALQIGLYNFFFALIISLFYYYVRFYSKAELALSFLLMAVLISFSFYLIGHLFGVSAFNSFGLLIYTFLEKNVISFGDVVTNFIVHIISPIFGASIVTVLFRAKFFAVRLNKKVSN